MNDPMDHLDYEVEMLSETYVRAAYEKDRILQNALIESFCTHARLLFELFEKEAGTKPKYSAGFKPKHNPVYYSKILNNQISHLGALRTHDPQQKIDHAMRTDMVNRIRDDLSTFKACMLDQSKAAQTRDVPQFTIAASALQNATNAIQTSTSGTTTTTSSQLVVASGGPTKKSGGPRV
jgi:hypothetical protein